MPASLLLLLAAAPAQEPAPYSGFPEQDVLSYEIYLKADPGEEGMSGSCRYRIRAVEELEAVRFHSLEGADWNIAFHDEAGVELAAERIGGGLLRVALGRAAAAGQEVVLHAVFSGTPPGGLYLEDNRYHRPVVFTDHFSARARGWLPCEDHPSDRAAFRILLEYPEDLVSIGSGDWGERPACPPPTCSCPAPGPAEGWTLSGGSTLSDLPTYQLAFAIGPYSRAEEAGDERLVPHYVWRKDRSKARRALKYHAEWMERMERTFGPYPYAKYCVVQVPTRWGGMENAGNTWIMESLFDRRGAGVGTLAHEFAHMWFGDGVGYAEWWDAWLSEGFASYFGPWLHAGTGGPPLQREMDGIRRVWLRSPAGRSRPIRWRDFDQPDDFFGSSSINTYQKGAWVLHMLRGEVGDEAFFGGIEAFYRDHIGQALATRDLVDALERSSGVELDWFFEQWLDRPGCPELELIWSEEGLVVRQVQGGQGLYRFWLRVRWTDPGGEAHSERFRIETASTEIPLGQGFRSPVVDPEVELLYRKV